MQRTSERKRPSKSFSAAGIDMRTLSIIGKDSHSDEQVVGYYNKRRPDDVWGKSRCVLGRLLGLTSRLRILRHSGFGPVLVRVRWWRGSWARSKAAVVVGGLSAIGAGLYGIGDSER